MHKKGSSGDRINGRLAHQKLVPNIIGLQYYFNYF